MAVSRVRGTVLIDPVSRYQLPVSWESTIKGWAGWLRMSGMAASSVTLRRSHIRFVGRATATPSPADLLLDDLVHLFSSRDWSREHRKAMRSSLSSFCGWCVDRGHMATNLADELPRVHAARPDPRPASDEQWETLLASARPRERLMGRLAGELGMRRGEVAAVHHRDLVRDPKGWLLIVTGKGGRQRVIPVPDDLASDILAHNPDRGWLFPNGDGGHLCPPYVGHLISTLLGPATMHQLRHRFASVAYARTHDLRAVQRVLGHSSLATTERYVLSTDDDDRAVVESVRENEKAPPCRGGGTSR